MGNTTLEPHALCKSNIGCPCRNTNWIAVLLRFILSSGVIRVFGARGRSMKCPSSRDVGITLQQSGFTNLFIPSRFWTTSTNFDNCWLRYVATCGKKLYRCTSTFSALNNCGGIFVKPLSYLYEVVRTNFSADFLTFRIFWPQFRN